jgi:hypothetical protein
MKGKEMSRTITPLDERFHEKYIIDQTTDCWIWQHATNNLGYGMIRDNDKMRTAHRVSYELHNQVKLQRNICVCHKCDNPLCVNPDHLWTGTHKQNTLDMMSKKRQNFFGGKSMKGFVHPKYKCKHCTKEVSKHMLDRHHNENCKLKPKK